MVNGRSPRRSFEPLERRGLAARTPARRRELLGGDHRHEDGDEQRATTERRHESHRRAEGQAAERPPSRFQLIDPAIRSRKSDVPEQVDRRSGDDDDDLRRRELVRRVRDHELVADRAEMIPATIAAWRYV